MKHKIKNLFLQFILIFCLPLLAYSQTIQDDFEGNGNISSWFGDDCTINTNTVNPFKNGINQSATVLKYEDKGGIFANVKFDKVNNFNLSSNNVFSIKIYVSSLSITGNLPNQVSLKLQDGTLLQPWGTQVEIIKPIVLNQWQTITFDFKNDNYINLNAGSLPPTQRNDFNRVLIQVNGENNTDRVIAFIDDVLYVNPLLTNPVFNKLVWSDEFNGSGTINSTKWFHQTQLPQNGSWFNGEIQHYTNRTSNSSIDNGVLKIVAKKENFSDQGFTKQYTSARLNSKFAFTYGRVEVRVKLPFGVGTWPAIWMLGKNIDEVGGYWKNQGFGNSPWPDCGEIDMMEHWGNNQNFIQSAIHTPSSYGGTVNLGGKIVSTASTDFHIYAMEWTSEKLEFSVDSIIYYTYNPSIKNADTWPFDKDQYLLLNVAIQQNIAANFTQSAMEVDYVRVYQQSAVSINQNNNIPEHKFFPNPVINDLTISFNNIKDQDVLFNIYSIDGKIVKSFNLPITNGSITLSDLKYLIKGMYFVSYKVNNKIYNLKFIKS